MVVISSRCKNKSELFIFDLPGAMRGSWIIQFQSSINTCKRWTSRKIHILTTRRCVYGWSRIENHGDISNIWNYDLREDHRLRIESTLQTKKNQSSGIVFRWDELKETKRNRCPLQNVEQEDFEVRPWIQEIFQLNFGSEIRSSYPK